MPSTLVHVGLAALLGTALLGDHFDARAILVVMAAAALPDLDTFIGLWFVVGGHRTILHNLVFPAIALSVVWWDLSWRERSSIRERWGDYGVRLVWVSIVAGWLTAQILLDAVHNGANLFWPLHDQFIDLSGHLIISDQRGIVQTFIEFERTAEGISVAPEHSRGTSEDTHYYTGVDPGPDATPDTERWLPVFDAGAYLLVAVAGYATAGFRLLEARSPTR